jgi:hypothetical protein
MRKGGHVSSGLANMVTLVWRAGGRQWDLPHTGSSMITMPSKNGLTVVKHTEHVGFKHNAIPYQRSQTESNGIEWNPIEPNRTIKH